MEKRQKEDKRAQVQGSEYSSPQMQGKEEIYGGEGRGLKRRSSLEREKRRQKGSGARKRSEEAKIQERSEHGKREEKTGGLTLKKKRKEGLGRQEGSDPRTRRQMSQREEQAWRERNEEDREP